MGSLGRTIAIAAFAALLWLPGSIANAGERPPVGVTLIPRGSAFQSFADYTHDLRFDSRTYDGTPIRSSEFEIRRMTDNLQIVRLPYLGDMDRSLKDERPARVEGSPGGFSEQIIRRVGTVPPGEYQIGFYMNGVRASNVASVKIDPGFDSTKAPTFQFGSVEAHPLAAQAILVLWVIGPTPTDEKLTNLALYGSALIVDGVERTRNGIFWEGPVGPYRSGARAYLLVDPIGLRPDVEADVPHEFRIGFGGHESAPFRFDPREHPLGDAWDAHHADLKIPPSPAPEITGRIFGPEGKPAVGYQVRLAANGSALSTEYTDTEGRFAFVGVPPGVYSVAALPPPPAGSPYSGREGIRVSDGKPVTCDLSFGTQYHFSGRVVDSEGRAVRNVPINATWNDEASSAEYVSGTESSADGSFTIKGPFKKISFVGIATNQWRSPPRYDVKPGDSGIKFVVKKQ